MRISASGLESTIAVAIDQILRLAPSIRPPIEPVVSRTKATSTVGLATAPENAAASGSVASANTSARMVMMGLMVFLQWSVPWNQVPLASRSRRVGSKTGADKFTADLAWASLLDGLKSDKVHGHGKARPPGQSRARARPSSVGDGAGDCARHRAAIAVAGVFLHQRIAAALGTACRSGGAERARRDLDRRNQILDRGSARRSEMAGLPDALRPAVLCLHPGSAMRDFPRANRADRGRCLWCVYALRGAGASAAGADPQADDGAVCDNCGAADQPVGRSAGPRGILDRGARRRPDIKAFGQDIFPLGAVPIQRSGKVACRIRAVHQTARQSPSRRRPTAPRNSWAIQQGWQWSERR